MTKTFNRSCPSRVASAALFLCAGSLAAGCSAEDPPGPSAAVSSAGAAGITSAGTGGTSGVAGSSGGSGSNSAGTGGGGQGGQGQSQAGTSAGGMSGGAGGTAGGGGGGMAGGRGGAGGSGGGSAGAGGGGGKVAANPSAGCGKASPQTGTSGQPLTVSGHDYYVKLPANYNADTPYKVMIVFPPTGNAITWSEQSAGYEKAAPDAIRVYTHMANQSSGWQPNETSFFKPFYDDITSHYCIDKNRVFAGGESSGGEFAGFVGCENGDLLRGVIPNAPKMTSWKIDPASHTCKGNPTAIVSWSEKDTELQQPAGPAFRDFYRDRNMCQMTSTAVQGYTDALSNCKLFDGCKEGSNTYYCMHSDPNYSNTYHGWPGFMAKMSWGVFSAL